MKLLQWMLLLPLAISCFAQDHCTPGAFSQATARVIATQKDLEQTSVGEAEDQVPQAVADKIIQLKETLSRATNAALSCARPSVDSIELQRNIARALHANEPEYDGNPNIPKDDPRFEKLPGYYGHNLKVQVNRPAGSAGILAIQFSFDIECGDDNLLLAYELRDGVWTLALRWQSPPLKSISDAFGDFFVSAFLHEPSAIGNRENNWRVAVAHGTSWCQSRFSNFKIDLLAPSSDPASPHVLWHTERDYSRGDFDPRIKSSGNTFELRLNADCMVFDSVNCYERRVIYRYNLDVNNSVRRVGPIGINARGFVEEWLSAPWTESRYFSAPEAIDTLQKVHDQFDQTDKPSQDQYIRHSFGLVQTCADPRVFQVQINSTLEKVVPGKPGGESKLLPTRHFHVREEKDGYLMLSAPTEADTSCRGADLIRPKKSLN